MLIPIAIGRLTNVVPLAVGIEGLAVLQGFFLTL
jgi:hypothetical protein